MITLFAFVILLSELAKIAVVGIFKIKKTVMKSPLMFYQQEQKYLKVGLTGNPRLRQNLIDVLFEDICFCLGFKRRINVCIVMFLVNEYV